MIGKTISHYHILEELGRGGMGIVYKAEDTRLKRTVALKFLPPEMTRDKEAKKRFIQEAQAAAALEHNNICNIYEIDETEPAPGEPGGQTFIAMACYEGETLKDKIRGKGNAASPLPLQEAIDTTIQIAEGLKEAHEKNIVHRDIKPANIMVTSKGQVKIMDFGLAKLAGRTKLTKTGTTLGTVAYMSPEQTRGDKVDHRSDIWSLGVILYEMITGQLPFRGDYDQAVSYAIVNEEPEPMTGIRTGVPMELERITNKSLVKSPDERYQNISDLIVDLKSLEKERQTSKEKTQPKKSKTPGRKLGILVGSAALLIVIIIGVIMFFIRSNSIDTIAVLPFKNVTHDPELEYLCDGLTEAVIESIQQIGGLKKVAPRTSAFYYKGKDFSPGAIGQKLGVRALLFGEVNQYRTEVSVSVELVDALKNNRIWGDRFTRLSSEITTLQEDISTKITENLRVELTEEDYTKIKDLHPENSEAYHLYLQGRFHLEKMTREGLKRSINLFKKAVKLDPHFARAYTSLAVAYSELPAFQDLSMEAGQDSAMSAVLKALEIDNTLSQAYSTLSTIKMMRFPLPILECERDLKKALSLDPKNSEAYHFYAHHMARMGRVYEGLKLMEKALELEPLSENINSCMIENLLLAGKLDGALRQSRKLEELYPGAFGNKWWLGWVYVAKGQFDDAIAFFEKSLDADPRFPVNRYTNLGYVYAVTGQREKALEQLAHLQEYSKDAEVDPANFAGLYAGLGEIEEALDWLEKAVDENAYSIYFFKTSPMFNHLQKEPRFLELVKKIGMDVELEGYP